MSVRITIDDTDVADRDRYGVDIAPDRFVRLHVFTTITHNVVGIQMEIYTDGTDLVHVPEFETCLSNYDAENLALALLAGVAQNREREA